MIKILLGIILIPVALAAIILTICLAIGFVKAFKKKKTKTIYCGDEHTTEFLQNSLVELLGKVSCKTVIIDGEYHLEVKI